MKNLLIHFILFISLLSLILITFYFLGKKIWYPYYEKAFLIQAPTSIPLCKSSSLTQKVIIEKQCIEPISKNEKKLSSQQKLNRHLADNNFVFYPKNLTLIGLKYEKILEVWTRWNGKNIHIISYPFTGFSGTLGPKFQEGDRQIPEGFYGISYLNPNSKFHLSMRINYPNHFDKKMAKKEKRNNLGSDIMIHGSNRTIGCIPIGDDKIEELYFLVEKVGIQNTKVILAPIDFRKTDVNIKTNKHPWLKNLYQKLKQAMIEFQ